MLAVGFSFPKPSKTMPIFKKGRMYFVFKCGSDEEWSGQFCEDAETSLYHVKTREFENLELLGWEGADKSVLAFLSVPIGDAQLVRFIVYAQKQKLGLFSIKGYPSNVFRIRKTDVAFNLEAALDCFNQGKYQECADMLIPFCKENGFIMRYTILSLIRLNPQDDRIRPFIQWYMKFDPDSVFPPLVFAFWANKVKNHYGEAFKCANKIRHAASLGMISKDVEPRAAHVIGELYMHQKDYDNALVCFRKTYRTHLTDAIKLFIAQNKYQHAYTLCSDVANAFYSGDLNEEQSAENQLCLAKCMYALGMLSCAKAILKNGSFKLEEWVQTSQRICQFCAKFLFHGNDIISCPHCEEAFYCSETCFKNGVDGQKKTNHFCRFCEACEKYIPFDTKRLYCSGCYMYFYCSEECQMDHWEKQHKKVCKSKK